MYKRLRDMREDKDLKQRELAEMLNVSQTTYSRYESGELDIPSAALIKLADFYNVSVDYILGIWIWDLRTDSRSLSDCSPAASARR